MLHTVRNVVVLGDSLFGAGTAAGDCLGAEPAGLAIDFTQNSALVRGHTTNFSGVPQSLFTVVRASSAAYFGSAGLLQTVSSNVLRLDYNPLTLAALGLLAEEARTNLFNRSEDLGNAYWTKENCAASTSGTAPDGTATAQVVTASNTTPPRLYKLTVSAAGVATLSFFYKIGSGFSHLHIRCDESGGTKYGKCIALATDVLTAGKYDGVIATTAPTSASVQTLLNGWRRFQMTFPVTATVSTLIYFSKSATDTATPAPAGGETVSLWGLEPEVGAFASSYISAPVGAQVTRARDDISLANTAYKFSATAGILVMEATTPSASAAVVLANIDDGTDNERIRIERNTSNEIHCIVTVGGVAQCDLNLGTVANSTAFKVALAWKANDFAASLNGAALVTDVSGTLPTVTTLRIGGGVTGNWSSWVKKAKHLPRERTNDAELMAFAA